MEHTWAWVHWHCQSCLYIPHICIHQTIWQGITRGIVIAWVPDLSHCALPWETHARDGMGVSHGGAWWERFWTQARIFILLAWKWTKHSLFCTFVTHVATHVQYVSLYWRYVHIVFDIRLDSNLMFYISVSSSSTYLCGFLYWKIIHCAHGEWLVNYAH